MAVTINGDGVVDVGGNASSAAYVRLYEDSDNGTNYVDLIAPASVASNKTITLPDATTTVVGTDATQTLTNKTLTSPTINGTPVMGASVVTSGTSVASTSGTSIDFTGIPSWVKRITVMFSGVSTNSSSPYLVQIGDSGGIETTGYVSGANYTSTGLAFTNSTAGFVAYSQSGASVYSGTMTISNIASNTWVSNHTLSWSGGASIYGGGNKTLSDTLDRVRITTVNGTDTFDAGSINILYE